jgi:hypothetical protein
VFLFFVGHPWIRNYNDIKLPLDILIFRLIKAYIRSSSLRKAALRVSIQFFVLISFLSVHSYTAAASVWQSVLTLSYLKFVLLKAFNGCTLQVLFCCLEVVDEFPIKSCLAMRTSTVFCGKSLSGFCIHVCFS